VRISSRLTWPEAGALEVGEHVEFVGSAMVAGQHGAHPAVVSVADFTQVQLIRRSRASGGIRRLGKLERSSNSSAGRPYLLPGLVRYEICQRKMQGGAVRSNIYYRCLVGGGLATISLVVANEC
jgi:hypothetical protein